MQYLSSGIISLIFASSHNLVNSSLIPELADITPAINNSLASYSFKALIVFSLISQSLCYSL